MNLYEVLGVGKTSRRSTIKKAYYALAKRHHPDIGGDPEKFREAHVAYSVLRDTAKRKRYDETGAYDEDTINSEATRVMKIIVDLFQAFCDQGLAFKDDIDAHASLVKALQDQIDIGNGALGDVREALLRYEGLRGRMMRKLDDKANVFENIIEDKIKALKQQREGIEKAVKDLTLAMEEMENYTSIDKLTQTPMHTYFQHSDSASTATTGGF